MTRYAEIRGRIRSGDLLAWEGRSIGARLVRWWTGARISHTGVALWIGPRLFSVEARPGLGVTMRLLSSALPVEWSALEIERERWSQAEDYALRQLGRNYSWLDALRAGLGLPPKRWNGYQCAEFVRAVLRRAGLEMNTSGLPLTPAAVRMAAETETSSGHEHLEGEH
jgi:hypothetical protein